MAKKKTPKKTTARKKRKSTRGKKKKQQFSLFKFLFKWGFVLGLWTAIAIAGLCAYYATELPDITENATFERDTSIIVKAIAFRTAFNQNSKGVFARHQERVI